MILMLQKAVKLFMLRKKRGIFKCTRLKNLHFDNVIYS